MITYLIEIAKIAGIIIALVALRLIVQSTMKNSKAIEWMKRNLTFLMPPLITGGPMFIAIPAAQYAIADPSVSSYLALSAFAGGAGLGIGLVMLLARLMHQEREIRELRTLIDRQLRTPGAQ